MGSHRCRLALPHPIGAPLAVLPCRSAALAGSNQASRLGGVLAPAIIYISQQLHWAALPFAVAGAVSILTGALLRQLPETMGKGQPETTADLERMYGNHLEPSVPGNVEEASVLARWLNLVRGASKNVAQKQVCLQPKQWSQMS